MNSNNPFANFDIDHLSASSLNTYINDPCMFIIRYLFKHKGTGNPAMWRGSIVDEIIGEMLTDKRNLKNETLIKRAEKRFQGLYDHWKKEITIDEDKYYKEKSNLSRYLEVAIPFYKQLGKPKNYQKKISLQLESIPIEIIGYIDLQYEGILRDIKTVGRMPSNVPDSVKRQLSIYAVAENSEALVDYIFASPKKTEIKVMKIENIKEHLIVVEKVAIAVMNLLSFSNDKYEIAKLFYPNFDSWIWSNKEDIEFAKSIWS